MLHLVCILFPHINDEARSKSHQINLYFKSTTNERHGRLTGNIANTSLKAGLYSKWVLNLRNTHGDPVNRHGPQAAAHHTAIALLFMKQNDGYQS